VLLVYHIVSIVVGSLHFFECCWFVALFLLMLVHHIVLVATSLLHCWFIVMFLLLLVYHIVGSLHCFCCC
jgi:hypothetical protein